MSHHKSTEIDIIQSESKSHYFPLCNADTASLRRGKISNELID